jgi:hypothetical protein
MDNALHLQPAVLGGGEIGDGKNLWNYCKLISALEQKISR